MTAPVHPRTLREIEPLVYAPGRHRHYPAYTYDAPSGTFQCWRCFRVFEKPQEFRWAEWYPDKGGMVMRVECRSADLCDGEARTINHYT